LKNRTFAFNGRRLVQFGLQNTPVVVTAEKKSAAESRASTFCHAASRSTPISELALPANSTLLSTDFAVLIMDTIVAHPARSRYPLLAPNSPFPREQTRNSN
jgi:hypothetical protein